MALSKLMLFKYQQNKTANENLFRFTQIITRIAVLGVTIPDDLKITVLLDSLQISWEAFRQAFTAREYSAKSFVHLTEAIETEALRRGKFDTNEVTALFSNLNISGRRQHHRRNFRRRSNSTTRRTVTQTSDVICYNCNQRGHMKAQCRKPRQNIGQNRRQGTSRRPQQNQRRNQGQRRHQRRPQPQAQANFSEAIEAEAFVIEGNHVEANSASIKDEFVVDSGTNVNSRAHFECASIDGALVAGIRLRYSVNTFPILSRRAG